LLLLLLLVVVVVVVVEVEVTVFKQGIYNYVPETNHVPMVYNVAANL
jgi:hypothetical protein